MTPRRREYTRMPQEFDAYHKWLGIAPKDQPPHHYRLLGIDAFEDDRDVIDAAANRVMSYLKELATGDDATYSQKLLNEVAGARLCLLNPKKKAAYDKDLKSKLSPQRLPPPKKPAAPPKEPPPPGPLPMSPPKPTPSAQPVPVAVRVRKTTPVQEARGKSNRLMPLIAGGAVVLTCVVLLAVFLLSDRGDTSGQGPDSATKGGSTSNSGSTNGNANLTEGKEYASIKAKMLTATDPSEAAELACQILQEHNPDDEKARDIYGRWLCLEKGDWPEGLEQLSKASDENLRSAATKDLAGAADASQQLDLGDTWHRLAASHESLGGFLDRANHWYDLALEAEAVNDAVETAGRILAKNPDHPKANSVRGMQLCLTKGDWKAGIEQLAKGSDIALREAASLELASVQDAAQETRLGDAWYDVAKSDSSMDGFLDRAVYWYGLALTDAKGDDGVRAASRILEVDAEDPTASLIYGRHLCLSAEDWKRGLSLLANGTDAGLRGAAIQDLANPSTTSERVRLGDAWYKLATSDTSLAGLLLRARHWYELALPDLADEERERVLRLLAPYLADAAKEELVALLEPRLTEDQITVVRELLRIVQETPRTTFSSSWKPLANDGELTDCYTLGPIANATRPAVLLWLSDPPAARRKRISFEWKPTHAYEPDEKQKRSGQKGQTFAGPVVTGQFMLYKFQIRSDADQQVELNASTYAAAGSRNVMAVSVDGVRLRKNRMTVPLRRGEHVILVDLAHSGSSNPDHCWMRITLDGKEPISQMGVLPADGASVGAARATSRVLGAMGSEPTAKQRPNAVDVLSLADPNVHGEGNHWRRVPDGIEANNLSGASFLTIPYKPPAEYNLHVTMTKQREKSNAGNDTHIVVPRQSKSLPFIVRHHEGLAILSFFSGDGNRNLTGQPPRGVTLEGNSSFATRRKVTFEVRPSAIRVLLDAEPLFTLDNNVSVRTNDEGLRLGSWQNQTLFHSVIVEPVE